MASVIYDLFVTGKNKEGKTYIAHKRFKTRLQDSAPLELIIEYVSSITSESTYSIVISGYNLVINRGIPVDTEIANSILAKIETIIKSNPDAAGQIDVMEIVISTLAEEATLKKLVAQKSSESSNSLTGITPTSSEKNLDKNPQPTNLALPQLSNNTQKANLRPPHTSRPASGAFFSVTRAHNVNANVPPPLTPGCPHPPEQARRSASLYTRHK